MTRLIAATFRRRLALHRSDLRAKPVATKRLANSRLSLARHRTAIGDAAKLGNARRQCP